uniref:Uncharacterized protein n=2 Tax=Physcomitrium patens TaxID=3218 RepID=A0A7I4DE54_PHYPA
MGTLLVALLTPLATLADLLSIYEVLISEDIFHWYLAIESEYNSLIKNGT